MYRSSHQKYLFGRNLFMKKKKSIGMVSVIIPVYKSELCLKELYDRTHKVIQKYTHGRYEVIFIDDDSPDGACSVLRDIVKSDSKVRIIRLMKNVGQHNAILCGIRHARSKYLLMMDDDLQNPPEEIPKLIDYLIGNDLDAVFGIPYEKKHSLYRKIGSLLNDLILNISIKKPRHLRLSSFRAITSTLGSSISEYKGEYVTIGGLICMLTRKMGNIVVEHHSRIQGTSGYTMRKLLKLTMNNMINFSMFPLRIMSYVGFFSFLFAFFYSIVVILQKISGVITSAGFATTVILSCFFSGLILLSIGILGEYIMKVVRGTYTLPQYTIRESITANNEIDDAE
jgi:polyisoprenyl-phosphate glycosyltransferase